MFAFLGLWRFTIYAAVIAAIIGGFYYAKGKYDAGQQEIGAQPYKDAISRQKQEAREKLAAETERVKATERERDGRIATIVERYSDERIKSNADFNKRLAAAGRLRDQDGGRGNSGCSTTSGETGNAGTTSGASEGQEISSRFDRLLKDLIRDTKETIDQYEFCQSYAKEVSSQPKP